MRILSRRVAWFVPAALVVAAGSCGRDEPTGVPGVSAERTSGNAPLGNVLLFITQDGLISRLAVMSPDGSDRRVLTPNDEHSYGEPDISPDGRRLVFTRFDAQGIPEGLFLSGPDASGQTLLVHRSFLIDYQARWSPDGRQIAFQSYDDGPFGALAKIFVINVDGTGLRQLSPAIDEQNEWVVDEGPSWSPDGTRLAFTRNAQLYIINADGTGFTAIPNEDGAQNVSWSPDGTRLAYQSMNPWGDIHVRNVDGSNLVNVTDNAAQEGQPRWSPDGRQLLFTRVVAGPFQLFTIHADGTGEKRVSFGSIDVQGVWSPFPRARSGAGAAIEITPDFVKLEPMETRQLTATVRNSNGTVLSQASVSWSSDNPAVASVTSSGFVTALDNGSAMIRAVFAGDTARAELRIAERVLRNVIVYTTDEFPGPHLIVVRPDGTGRRRLTTDFFGYRSPEISPDGRRIAFVTDFSIFAMNADAAGIGDEGFTFVFFSFGLGELPDAPAWSPDGSLIAFRFSVQRPLGLVSRIFVVNADGSGGLRQVSPDDPDPSQFSYNDDGPTWSPDGTRLIFTRNGVLHVINADGTGLAPLPNEDGASLPDWSPNGARVAYANATGDIVVRNADGSDPVQLTATGAQESSPRWAPDNARLVFCRMVNGVSQLFTINADGTSETRLSANAAANECGPPSWSPLP